MFEYTALIQDAVVKENFEEAHIYEPIARTFAYSFTILTTEELNKANALLNRAFIDRPK